MAATMRRKPEMWLLVARRVERRRARSESTAMWRNLTGGDNDRVTAVLRPWG